MADPEAALGALVQQALGDEFGAEHVAADPLIRPSAFADFQSNVAMSLSKLLGRSPRDVAGPVAERLNAAPAVARAEVSGPGFINITLADEWIAAHSPQAKGRIERLFGTLQDRLVKEMRLAGIDTLERATRPVPATQALCESNAIRKSFRPTASGPRESPTETTSTQQTQIHSASRSPLAPDISTWQKSGHFYFALTPDETDQV